MSTLETPLDRFLSESTSTTERGQEFEHLTKAFVDSLPPLQIVEAGA